MELELGLLEGAFRLGFPRGMGRAPAQTGRREEKDKAVVAIVDSILS
jgi:hypothetical protein